MHLVAPRFFFALSRRALKTRCDGLLEAVHRDDNGAQQPLKAGRQAVRWRLAFVVVGNGFDARLCFRFGDFLLVLSGRLLKACRDGLLDAAHRDDAHAQHALQASQRAIRWRHGFFVVWNVFCGFQVHFPGWGYRMNYGPAGLGLEGSTAP